MSIETGVLYIVATPIGNLGDMSPRAVEILSGVDLIAAEDTRHSARLLNHFGINTRCIALHEHNERDLSDDLINRLKKGESMALISDAGTPLISDPGYPLVQKAHESGIKVVTVPGPSACMAALSVSGLPTDRFAFEGFLPARGAARRTHLEPLVDEPRTLIFYESPHRIRETLGDMRTVFGGDREAVIARELTKTFETVRRDSLDELTEWLEADANQQKGEFVILVRARRQESGSNEQETTRILQILLPELPLRQAVALTVKITGQKKNLVYEQAVKLKK